MTLVRHQTTKLSGGWHDSPDEGVCVMDSPRCSPARSQDEPVSVCPVIAAFLRRHNDSIDDQRRQDLQLAV